MHCQLLKRSGRDGAHEMRRSGANGQCLCPAFYLVRLPQSTPTNLFVGPTFKMEGYSTPGHSRPATPRRCLSFLASPSSTFFPDGDTMHPSRTSQKAVRCTCICLLHPVFVFVNIHAPNKSCPNQVKRNMNMCLLCFFFHEENVQTKRRRLHP